MLNLSESDDYAQIKYNSYTCEYNLDYFKHHDNASAKHSDSEPEITFNSSSI